MAVIEGRVHSLNVKPKVTGERGLPKQAVPSAEITANGLAGDFNRYRTDAKGGTPDMAVLIMPLETLEEIQADGWPVRPGHIGENITTTGIGYADLPPGTRVRIGEADLEITEACQPCVNLRLLPYVGRARVTEFIRAMIGRRGWYARVIRPGPVQMGDAITVSAEDVQ